MTRTDSSHGESPRRKVIVVAEIGENHLGDLGRARDMVAAAAGAGADSVKFQTYRGADVADDDPERDWFSQVELSDAEHFELADVARQNGVEFMSAPFTLERARFLVEELGSDKVKVASSELTNVALLEYLAGRVRSVFLSTGMSFLDEVSSAADTLAPVEELYLMHCTTAYPCP